MLRLFVTPLLALVLVAGNVRAATTAQAPAGPVSGDVFREYVWVPKGTLHVLDLKQKPIDFPGVIDRDNATRAELVFEMGNAHLGYEAMAVKLNDGPWTPIPFPGVAPKTAASPSLFFHQWWPVIPVALSDVAATDNHFELRIGPDTFDKGNKHPAWTPIYGVILRVYYAPAKKPHPSGQVIAPRAGATVGETVELKAKATAGKGHEIARIDYLGELEDINREGDGLWRRWHYTFRRGQINEHLGSTTSVDQAVTWDTSWVPDQTLPMRFMARITDDTGLVAMTAPVGGVKLRRPGMSVELAKPTSVPEGFTSCQYGIYIHPGPRSETFEVKGDLAKLTDARFFQSCWNCPSGHGFTINDVVLEDAVPKGEGGMWMHVLTPLRPLTALKAGVNTFATVPGPKRSSDLHLPGVSVLLKYRNGGQ